MAYSQKYSIVQFLEPIRVEAVFSYTDWPFHTTLAGYLPHITSQKSEHIPAGTEVAIRELSLIDMFVNKDWQQRQVIRQFGISQ